MENMGIVQARTPESVKEHNWPFDSKKLRNFFSINDRMQFREDT